MESKKINQLATELAPDLSDLTIIGDPTTGISKKITLSQMASLFTGTVEEYANLAAFPLVGVADTIYIALDTNILYRWNTGTSAYVELSPNIVSSLVFNDANGFDGTINLVGSVATLTITTALTTGSVGFIGASGALLQDNANFFWDDTNNRLGLGTNAPTTALDVFGSGIIGRLNGTSTNNSFLGFASAGTNKWSIGNVQSDHRFRIYSEATTSELVSVLSTGEFGIGIANPTTKFHIDGAASALIANLDANVSVAKSISFRSDNSNRINLEVSGTESGSNVGADLFIRTYTDAGSLLETPFSIARSTGLTTVKNIAITGLSSGYLPKANGSSALINSIIQDNSTTASINGLLNVGNAITASASININSNSSTAAYLYFNGAGVTNNHTYIAGLSGASSNLRFFTANTLALTLASSGIATFANDINVTLSQAAATSISLTNTNTSNGAMSQISAINSGTSQIDMVSFGSGSTGTIYGITKAGLKVIRDNSLAASSNGLAIGTDAANSFYAFTNSIRRFEIASNGQILTYNAPSADWGMIIRNANSVAGSSYGLKILAGTGSGDYAFQVANGANTTNLNVIRGDGKVFIYMNGADDSLNITNTHPSVPYGINIGFSIAAPNNTSQYFLNCSDSANTKLIIYSNGNVVNRNNSYGPLSDIKLKENITDTTSKLYKLMQVRIVNYNLIGDNLKQIGVIAQELEQVFPALVDENEDFEEVEMTDEKGNIIKEKKSLGTTTKSVKMSVFVPMLIKAMQEQQEQIEELKSLINK